VTKAYSVTDPIIPEIDITSSPTAVQEVRVVKCPGSRFMYFTT